MPEWLPKLTLPDIGVFLMTVFLCLAAARVYDVGDMLGRGWLRLFGKGAAPDARAPGQQTGSPPDPDAP